METFVKLLSEYDFVNTTAIDQFVSGPTCTPSYVIETLEPVIDFLRAACTSATAHRRDFAFFRELTVFGLSMKTFLDHGVSKDRKRVLCTALLQMYHEARGERPQDLLDKFIREDPKVGGALVDIATDISKEIDMSKINPKQLAELMNGRPTGEMLKLVDLVSAKCKNRFSEEDLKSMQTFCKNLM